MALYKEGDICAPSNINRFNEPVEPMTARGHGFMGFPSNFMVKPKQNLRINPSADGNRGLERLFGSDSPKQSYRQGPPPAHQPSQRHDEPPPQQYRPPSPPPQVSHRNDEGHNQLPHQAPPAPTISPRYDEHLPISQRRRPVIPDHQLRNMTTADIRKYEQAFTDSESDRLLSNHKKEEALHRKREEQEKVREMQASYNPYGLPGGGAPLGDNRKMKFTEYQLEPPLMAKYQNPKLHHPHRAHHSDHFHDEPVVPSEQDEPRYPGENNHMARGRTDFDADFHSPRKEDLLRKQERDMLEKRQSLERLERQKLMSQESRDERTKRYETFKTKKESDILSRQEREIHQREQQLRNLQAKDDFEVRRPPREREFELGRAQSDSEKTLLVFTSKNKISGSNYQTNWRCEPVTNIKIISYVERTEPQTDRSYRRKRDTNMFGHTDHLRPVNYYRNSPRREPVGQFYGTDTIYTTSFDEPTLGKTPRQIERNPYKNTMDVFDPFCQPGGGAPLIGGSGQRETRIQGRMVDLGRENSGNARLQEGKKKLRLRDDLLNMMAETNARKQHEKIDFSQPAIDYVDSVKKMNSVGYPKINDLGFQSEKQHLPHTLSHQGPHRRLEDMHRLKLELDSQQQTKDLSKQLEKQHERHLEKLHMDTFNKLYGGDYGGGNMKGPNLRKLNLDSIIHNPQQTNGYYNKVLVEGDNYFDDPDEYFDNFKPRITINSTHKNLYEYPDGNIKMTYSGRAPYAEHGSY